MAYKFYGHETFRVTLQDGTEYSFRCAVQNTRYEFRHVLDVPDGYAHGDRKTEALKARL